MAETELNEINKTLDKILARFNKVSVDADTYIADARASAKMVCLLANQLQSEIYRTEALCELPVKE